MAAALLDAYPSQFGCGGSLSTSKVLILTLRIPVLNPMPTFLKLISMTVKLRINRDTVIHYDELETGVPGSRPFAPHFSVKNTVWQSKSKAFAYRFLTEPE